MGMLGEIVVLTVLENEDTTFFQQVLLEDEVGNGGQLLQGVWRISKDEIILLVAGLDVAEDVGTKSNGLPCPIPFGKTLDTLLDKAVMVAVKLYADHLGTSSRQQLERDAARTGKEVESCGTLKVDVAHQYIEDVLLGEVRRGPRLERAGNIEVPPLVFSSNNSHS